LGKVFENSVFRGKKTLGKKIRVEREEKVLSGRKIWKKKKGWRLKN